jgi:hypothetical protein
MPALVSEKMKKALAMLKKDPALTAYAAAKATGISRSAISQNADYRALINSRKEKHAK